MTQMALKIQHTFFERLVKKKISNLISQEKRIKREKEMLLKKHSIGQLMTIAEEVNNSASLSNIIPTPEKVNSIPTPQLNTEQRRRSPRTANRDKGASRYEDPRSSDSRST